MKFHTLPISRFGLCLLAVNLPWVSQVLAANKQYDVVVDAGKHDRANEPVIVSLVLPEELKDVLLAEQVKTDKKIRILGQLTKPGLLDASTKIRPGYVRRDLHFILPKLKAGSSITIMFNISSKFKSDATNFKWTDTPGQDFLFLIRSSNSCGPGSYGSGGVNQVGARDGEIAASGGACP